MEQQPSSQIEILIERIEAYGKTTYELSKLKVLETTIHVATSFLSRLSVIVMISFFILILNIGVAIWLGELLGKMYYGFFIVAAFYLVAGVVLNIFLHKWIKKPISSFFIKQALQ